MADIIKTTAIAEYKFLLERDGQETTRTLSLDINPGLDNENLPAIRTALLANAATYMASYANANDAGSLIQTTSWRDDNDSENAYTCTGVETGITLTTKYTFSPT